MVAAEQDFAVIREQILKAQVVGGVARRVYGGEAGECGIVVQRHIRMVAGPPRDMERMDRRAGGGLERRGRPHMVVMGMGENDARDILIAGGFENIRYMLVVIRAGINDGDTVGAIDEIAVGAMIRHDAGVLRDDPANAWKDGQENTALRLWFL